MVQQLTFNDIRRFERLLRGSISIENPDNQAWLINFAGNLRDEFNIEEARLGCAILLGADFSITDPTAESDECLSTDELIDVDVYLGEARSQPTPSSLLDCVGNHLADVQDRISSVEALGNLKDVGVVEPMLHILRDVGEPSGLREAAACCLAELAGSLSVDDARRALSGDDEQDRSHMIGQIKKRLDAFHANLEHFKQCAACQLRYYEMLAISMQWTEQVETEDAPAIAGRIHPARHYSDLVAASANRAVSLLNGSFRIAAGHAAFFLGGAMAHGLLGQSGAAKGAETDHGAASEAHTVSVQSDLLQGAQLEIDDQDQTLTIRNVPEVIDASRLQLRIADQLLTPSDSGKDNARFDLRHVWTDGTAKFILEQAPPLG